jgi:ribosome-binding protein aMBF1 (putative translation factor)
MANKNNYTMEMIKGIKGHRILSEKEVEKMTQLLRDFLRREFSDMPEKLMHSAEEVLRMHSLRNRFQSAREARGLSIKEVAAQLKVPQYRLKAIEGGSSSEIKQDIFQKYSEFLDLEDWVSEWAAANKKVAAKLGLKPLSK